MLALKKKKEAEKKAAAEAAARKDGSSDEKGTTVKAEKVSLFGVGGKKKKDSGANGKEKRRTAGEIRIQKGMKNMAIIIIIKRLDFIYSCMFPIH